MTAQENRGDKMALLYDFLTGNEFRLQVEAIVEDLPRCRRTSTVSEMPCSVIGSAREAD